MKHWIAVISLEHAEIASRMGFLQVCHGKMGPLKRTSAGDEFFIYCPRTKMGAGSVIKRVAFRGHFNDNRIYQVEQFPGFHPHRKDVTFDADFQPVDILSVANPELTSTPHWGIFARRGFFEISNHDATLLRQG